MPFVDFKTDATDMKDAQQRDASVASGATDRPVHADNVRRPETAHWNKTEYATTDHNSGAKIQSVSGRLSF